MAVVDRVNKGMAVVDRVNKGMAVVDRVNGYVWKEWKVVGGK